MGMLWQDVRYGVRMLTMKPGFSLVIVLLVTIGVGANTVVFSVLNAFLIRSLPYTEVDRIVLIQGRNREGKATNVSYPDYRDWCQQARSFDKLASYQFWVASVRLTSADAPERCQVGSVSCSFFQILGVRPAVGRLFSEEDDRPGATPVAVISDAFWRQRFGGDSRAVGQSILLRGASFTVIGVTAPRSQFPPYGQELTEAWVPAALTESGEPRGSAGQCVLGRLGGGVTVQRAQDEMDIICARLAAQYPSTNAGISTTVRRLRDRIASEKARPLGMMMGAVVFVFLVACINVAGLLFAHAVTREREMAVRAALGANRLRLMRLLLIENLTLALLGGGLGVLGANGILPLLTRTEMIASMKLPAGFFDLDGRVLGFALLVAVIAVPLFGLLPSLWGSGLHLAGALSTSGRSVLGSRGRNAAHAGLLVAQVALTIVLSVAAGLMIRSLANVMLTDPGFDPKNVLTMTVELGGDAAKHHQLLDQLKTLPGIEKAGLAAPLFTGWTWYFYVEGEPVPLPDRAPVATYRAASPGYFEAMGIRLLRGRFFDEQDDARSKRVAIVDETFAKRYWPDGDWIGKRIQAEKSPNSGSPWLEIVGVVGRVKNEGVESKNSYPQIYQALFQSVPGEVSIIVRTKGEPSSFAASIKNLVYQAAGQRLIFDVRTMEAIQREHSNERRFITWLLAAFAGTALLLSGAGIYAITRYLVSRRTQEFGIRVALGANRSNILALVLRKSLLPVLAGAGLGLFATIAMARVLSTLLFGLSPWDPVTYVVASLVLAGVALVASYIPARWATRGQPVVALRYE